MRKGYNDDDLPVTLQHGHKGVTEEFLRVPAQRCATAERVPESATSRRLDLLMPKRKKWFRTETPIRKKKKCYAQH
jgi:hypothetical protein